MNTEAREMGMSECVCTDRRYRNASKLRSTVALVHVWTAPRMQEEK